MEHFKLYVENPEIPEEVGRQCLAVAQAIFDAAGAALDLTNRSARASIRSIQAGPPQWQK